MNLLFPSDKSDNGIIDKNLLAEYEAALNTGLFDVVLFDYEEWFHNNRLVISTKKPTPGKVIYRGWMMKPEKYRLFNDELSKQGLNLLTKPEEYERMHIFPNIFRAFGEDTARMIIFPDGEKINLEAIKKSMTKFIVKDYVKSVKGTDFPKYFDETVTQNEFDEWIEVFRRYRSALYTGGICIKEYLPLRKIENHTNEYRVFYAGNNVISISKNSGQGLYSEEPPAVLIRKYSNLDSPFYTVDYAQLEDESWKVIEAGDGSVSGLSDGQDYESFYRTLFYATDTKDSEN